MRTKHQAKQLGIVDYESANRYMQTSKTDYLCNNTRLTRLSDDAIGLQLHGHTIVVYHANGDTTLDSCGYRTSTTKDRLNRFTLFTVYQKNWNWFIVTRQAGHYVTSSFQSGMRINAMGVIVGGAVYIDQERVGVQ